MKAGDIARRVSFVTPETLAGEIAVRFKNDAGITTFPVVRAARPGEEASPEINHGVAWGPSPRASQALMLGIRARALLQGRLSPSIDDVAELIGPVFKHRMALNFTARAEGETIEAIIARQKNLLA